MTRTAFDLRTHTGGRIVANCFAIHSVAASLITWLRNRYPLAASIPCSFRLLSSTELAALDESPGTTTVGVYVHRVAFNPQARNHRAAGRERWQIHLDLHLLITITAGGALAEHTVAAWILRELETHPVFDRSLLSSDAAWQSDESVSFSPLDLDAEALARLWEAFHRPYRMTLPYLARVLRIDPEAIEDEPLPVVAVQVRAEAP